MNTEPSSARLLSDNGQDQKQVDQDHPSVQAQTEKNTQTTVQLRPEWHSQLEPQSQTKKKTQPNGVTSNKNGSNPSLFEETFPNPSIEHKQDQITDEKPDVEKKESEQRARSLEQNQSGTPIHTEQQIQGESQAVIETENMLARQIQLLGVVSDKNGSQSSLEDTSLAAAVATALISDEHKKSEEQVHSGADTQALEEGRSEPRNQSEEQKIIDSQTQAQGGVSDDNGGQSSTDDISFEVLLEEIQTDQLEQEQTHRAKQDIPEEQTQPEIEQSPRIVEQSQVESNTQPDKQNLKDQETQAAESFSDMNGSQPSMDHRSSLPQFSDDELDQSPTEKGQTDKQDITKEPIKTFESDRIEPQTEIVETTQMPAEQEIRELNPQTLSEHQPQSVDTDHHFEQPEHLEVKEKLVEPAQPEKDDPSVEPNDLLGINDQLSAKNQLEQRKSLEAQEQFLESEQIGKKSQLLESDYLGQQGDSEEINQPVEQEHLHEQVPLADSSPLEGPDKLAEKVQLEKQVQRLVEDKAKMQELQQRNEELKSRQEKLEENITQLTTRKRRVGLLEDDEGNLSSMRVMSFIALITSIILAGMTVQSSLESVEAKKKDHTIGVNITIAFLVAAFAPKAIQKYAEKYGGR